MSTRLDCDLLVAGSGAAGLAAAVTAAHRGLRVIVAEKAPVFGGTTAWSGGWIWSPCNPLARRAGIVEDAEAPRTYLGHVLGPHFDAARVDAFLAAAPRMVDFFEQHTALRFDSGTTIPDTYGTLPGRGPVAARSSPRPTARASSAASRAFCACPCARRRFAGSPSRPVRTCVPS